MLLLVIIMFGLFHGSLLNGMEQSENSLTPQPSPFAHNHEIIKRTKKILYISAVWSALWFAWGIKDIVYNQFDPNLAAYAWQKTGFASASLLLHTMAIPLAQDIKRNHS